MKKLLLVLLCLSSIFCFSACKKTPNVYDQVSELRKDFFIGEKDEYSIKAVYGYKEKVSLKDGKIETPIYLLSFKLLGYEENVTYTLSLNFNDKTYSENLDFNPVKNCLTLDFEIDDFNLKEFSINLKKESSSVDIVLKSILPDNTLDYKSALSSLLQKQPDLINLYKTENGYDLEIQMRIAVKDDKPYWFVGLTSKSGDRKILLIDGFSGEVLAVRDVF